MICPHLHTVVTAVRVKVRLDDIMTGASQKHKIDVMIWYTAELKICGMDGNVQAGNRRVSS